MSDRTYKIFSLIIFLATVAFPIYQLIYTGGFLYYTNGWDEASYLQYDYAKHITEISSSGRMAEWFVVFLHEAGLSGGYINLLFDVIVTLLILNILPLILAQAGIEKKFANTAGISILGLPLILSNLNSVFEYLQNLNMESDSLRYLTMPYINDPYWLRTPEPQLSIACLLVVLFISLKLKNNYSLFAISLLSYPFVGIPTAFCALTLIFIKKFRIRLSTSVVVTSTFISVLLLTYHYFFISEVLSDYIITGNFLLISFCGVVAALACLIKAKPNNIILILFFSIWFSVNFQLISGFTIQPNNFEQYWSAPVLVLILLLLFQGSFLIRSSYFVSVILILSWSVFNFRTNNLHTVKLPIDSELLQDIKSNPSLVAVNDILLSTRLDMLYSKQKPMLFSYTRFYKGLPNIFFDDFLCAKQVLTGNSDYTETVDSAEQLYINGDKNYVMNTILRTNHDLPMPDYSKKIRRCELKLYTSRVDK